MVEKGDVLITKKPAIHGSRGRNIKGEEVTPIPAKDIVILPGDGATVNEAGTIFSATTDGYVDFGNKRLGVYPVYMVKGIFNNFPVCKSLEKAADLIFINIFYLFSS